MQKLLFVPLSALLIATGFNPAFSAGESSKPATATTTSKPKLVCKKGEVIKKITQSGKKVNKCVKLQSGILPDEELYQQGRQLAKDGQYEWALQVLASIKNQNDPRVLNYTGYANRKAGRLEIGITYYRKALAIDPDFVLAREYLGEGYVASGRIDLAQVELSEIKKRAGANSEEYKDLSKAIATAMN